jgi:hypothetical protein
MSDVRRLVVSLAEGFKRNLKIGYVSRYKVRNIEELNPKHEAIHRLYLLLTSIAFSRLRV